MGPLLPSSIKNLGKFQFDGLFIINSYEVESDFNLSLPKGIVNASLNISNLSNIDNAIYSGYIKGVNIDISKFVNFKCDW